MSTQCTVRNMKPLLSHFQLRCDEVHSIFNNEVSTEESWRCVKLLLVWTNCKHKNYVRFMIMFFWVLSPCRLVSRSQRFGETYCLHLQSLCFSETLASTDESTRRQNPEEHHHHPHHRENLKSYVRFILSADFMESEFCFMCQKFQITNAIYYGSTMNTYYGVMNVCYIL
jgi:hypothetical protein